MNKLLTTIILAIAFANLTPSQAQGQNIGAELDRQKAFLRSYCNPPSPQMLYECQQRLEYAQQLQREVNRYIERQNNRSRQIERDSYYNNESLRESNCLASSDGC